MLGYHPSMDSIVIFPETVGCFEIRCIPIGTILLFYKSFSRQRAAQTTLVGFGVFFLPLVCVLKDGMFLGKPK